MELLQLRYFYDSAKLMRIAKTAENYIVPATSVSASIKRLDEELGCKLFDRLPNRILLNDKGGKLLESLTVVFNALDSVIGSLSDTADDTRKSLCVLQQVVFVTRQTVSETSWWPGRPWTGAPCRPVLRSPEGLLVGVRCLGTNSPLPFPRIIRNPFSYYFGKYTHNERQQSKGELFS